MPVSKAATTEDEVNLELEAMQTISRTLISLRDSQTRDRVLRLTIDSLVRGFASDVRALALQWQRA